MNAVSILVGGSFPLKLPAAVVAPLTSGNALVPVRVINVDLADLVLYP
jgi:hypothetical protein